MQIHSTQNFSYNKQQNQVSFGLNNPKAALYRAQKIKKEYATQGINYLLPNEVWSTKKIMTAIGNFGENIDNMFKRKKITPAKVQEEINNFIPLDKKGKIKVKDFEDFYNLERFKNIPKSFVKNFYSGVRAMTLTDEKTKDITLYFRFPKFFASKDKKNTLKCSISHELKHAFSRLFENVGNHEQYTNPANSEIPAYNAYKVFNDFLVNFCFPMSKKPAAFTKENLYNKLDVKNNDELEKQFDKYLDEATQKFLPKVDFKSLSKEKQKSIYEIYKNFARDEKEAYSTTKIYREMNKSKQPTEAELRVMLFDEMEKYFALKIRKSKECP